ncbi:MAG: MFS transporter, partial [Bacteroidota bacterium]|nr:MFS transporter [Bacteroidota bacterium]
LTALGISNTAAVGSVPDSVRYSFDIGAIVFFASVAYTVFTTREYSPEELKSFDTPAAQAVDHSQINTTVQAFYKKGFYWLVSGSILSFLLYNYNHRHPGTPLEKELYVLTFGIAAFGLIQLVAGTFWSRQQKNGLVEVVNDLYEMPQTMKQLAVVQFFSWFALFAMWIYSTPGLAQNIAHTTDTSSPQYNEIGNWVGVLFAFYNGFAALFAFLLPKMASRMGRPVTHLVCLVAGGLGLISFVLFSNQYLLVISMAGIGLAWSSILSMPYSMLTAALPSKKMGVYMGIFNFFIVIPQILAATLLGFFTKHVFGGDSVYTIVLGGFLMLVAALLNLRIKEK